MNPNIDIAGSWIEIGMAVAALAVGIFIVIIPLIIKNKKFKKIIGGSIEYPKTFNWNVHTQIHEILTELRVKTDCARSQLIQFHNGGEFLDGISMKKMSLTHESLASGCSSEMEVKKDLLLSLCVEGLSLLKNDEPKLHIVEQMDDSWCKKFMQTSNTISFCFLPIRTKNTIMGYVMCQWCSWSKTDEIDESPVSEELESARNTIEMELHKQIGHWHT